MELVRRAPGSSGNRRLGFKMLMGRVVNWVGFFVFSGPFGSLRILSWFVSRLNFLVNFLLNSILAPVTIWP